ncbi:MAG: cell division protein FtsA, partial [Patescibacteria group bacterium]|nr:cell division protein FtsA [Patescibacteria group bacterium]
MARRNISTGIDIGSSNIRVVVAEYTEESTMPTIIGSGIAESKGLRHGYIVNMDEVTESIRDAVAQAEKSAGMKIKKAFIAIGGLSLESAIGTGSVFVSRADNEVTEIDVKKALEASEASIAQSANKQIIHPIPISFKLDGEEVMGKPAGLKGSRLEVKTLFITCLHQHLDDFIHAVEDIGVRVEDIMASPIAAGFVTLTKRQKTAGCVLANIGAETLSLVVFENNIPISLKVFPIGGSEITNDIALGLKIPLEEAEEAKRGSGMKIYSKKKLDDIIEARLSDIFEIIDSHLKKIGKNGLLPAGIIITGGTSAIPLIEELAKMSLRLPSQVAQPDFAKNTNHQIVDSNWSVVYGLCIMGIDNEGEEGVGIKLARRTKGNLVSWIKQFLP